MSSDEDFNTHLSFVSGNVDADESTEPTTRDNEVLHAPLFSSDVQHHLPQPVYTQYGLLGKEISHRRGVLELTDKQTAKPNLIYGNHGEPSSTFIIGSQGSGKSHTLSAYIENCILTESSIAKLPHPLPALAFHYDPYTSYCSTQHCELAYFCSAGVKVRVLVSESNFHNLKRLYEHLPGLPDGAPKPTVLKLKLTEKQLNVGNMMTLMNVRENNATPLYLAVINEILRDMAKSRPFRQGIDYQEFRQRLVAQNFADLQVQMLNLRLSLLDSFLDLTPTKKGNLTREENSDIWDFEPGTLTIVDLSSDFVSPGDACAFFNVCLNLFMAGRNRHGRVVALDEAHKFLTQTGEAHKLTESLMSIIRQQRHLATRVIITTQEPTLDPRLLDLCNVVIVHRFNSPAWFKVLQEHLAGSRRGSERESMLDDIFRTIISLKTGTALLFSPTAVLHVEVIHEDSLVGSFIPVRLMDGFVKIRIRKRITADGGRSILASDKYVLPEIVDGEIIEISSDSDETMADLSGVETHEVLPNPPLPLPLPSANANPVPIQQFTFGFPRSPTGFKPTTLPQIVNATQNANSLNNTRSRTPPRAVAVGAAMAKAAEISATTAAPRAPTTSTRTITNMTPQCDRVLRECVRALMRKPTTKTVDFRAVREKACAKLQVDESSFDVNEMKGQSTKIIHSEISRVLASRLPSPIAR